RADELTTLADLELDVVDERTERHVTQAHRVARLHVGVLGREHGVTGLEPVGREDVRLLAVRVVEERDARRAVRIVLDRGHARGHPDLVPAEVDLTVAALVPAATEAAGDAP